MLAETVPHSYLVICFHTYPWAELEKTGQLNKLRSKKPFSEKIRFSLNGWPQEITW
jgi:hypothetical protein